MRLIPNITNQPRQIQTILLDNGLSFEFEIYYMPLQQGWFIESLTYGDFILNGFRISNFPNMLHQWRNILPFGLACRSVDDRDPTLQEDFSSRHSELLLLSEAEVDAIARNFSGQV
jgi:hypothetical protein